MYRLKIGLGWNALKKNLEPSYKNSDDTMHKINQHSLIINETIINYYEEKAKEARLCDQYQTYISSIIGYANSTIRIKSEFTKFRDVLDNYIKGKRNEAVYIYTEDDPKCSRRCERLQYGKIATTPSNLLSLYSHGNSITLKKGENASKYISFLENVFKGEGEITFVDKYLLQHFNMFYSNYIPLIQDKTKVIIFSDTSYTPEIIKSVIQKLQRDRGIELIIKDLGRSVHDRYIFTSDSKISIGAGIEFCNFDNNPTKIKTMNELEYSERIEKDYQSIVDSSPQR